MEIPGQAWRGEVWLDTSRTGEESADTQTVAHEIVCLPWVVGGSDGRQQMGTAEAGQVAGLAVPGCTHRSKRI